MNEYLPECPICNHVMLSLGNNEYQCLSCKKIYKVLDRVDECINSLECSHKSGTIEKKESKERILG